MPIYEYRCSKCEHAFEHLARSMGDNAPVACPDCGSEHVERQLSVFAARQGEAGPHGSCDTCPGSGGSCPYKS